MDSLVSSSSIHPRREGWGHRFRTPTERHRRLCEEALPRLCVPEGSLTAPERLFPQVPQSLWLEIGFGNGEHLAAHAQRNPHIGYIGCEIFPRGMVHMVDHAVTLGLQNVRLTSEPALELLKRLPPVCTEGVFILYPDPWPKTRHYKRRLISDECVERLADILVPGGRVYLATDHAEYASWILARFLKVSSFFSWRVTQCQDWLQPWDGWQSTVYERKALKRNIRPVYLTFIRKS